MIHNSSPHLSVPLEKEIQQSRKAYQSPCILDLGDIRSVTLGVSNGPGEMISADNGDPVMVAGSELPP